MAGEEFGQAFGQALGEAIGQGLAAAFLLMFLLAIAVLASAVLVFLIGLQKRPRTTLLSYTLAVLFALLGNALGYPQLVLLGFATGIVFGHYRFTDTPYPAFTSRPYTILLNVASAGSILVSITLFQRLLESFGPHILDEPLLALPVLGILSLPALTGIAYLLGSHWRRVHRLIPR